MSTPLIKINMLPYREQLDLEKQAQFKRLMMLALVAGIGLAGFTFVTLKGMAVAQESRNEELRQGIAELDVQIKEVQSLREEKALFLARKRKVEELETKRFEAARMLDSLNALAPEGVYLTAIKSRSATEYTLVGKATTDSKIADFMRVIPDTQVFGQPSLALINKVDNLQEFELMAVVMPPVQDAAQTQNAGNGATSQ